MRIATLLFLLLFSSVVFAQDVKVLKLKASDIVYLPSTGRLYVSTFEGGQYGNSLCVVNPYFGTIEAHYPIDGAPGVLAASDDEKFIYIGLRDSPEVARFDLASHTVGLRFPLGIGAPPYGPYYAEDIAVMPGSPQVVAVARRALDIIPWHAGVAIYDEGAMRPNTTPVHTGSNSIAFDPATGFLYGYNNETSEFGIRKMSLSANGVAVESATPGLLDRFYDEIKFADGKLYSNFGKVVNVTDGPPVLEGEFDLAFGFPVVEVSPDSNVVFFINSSEAAISFLTYDKSERSFREELKFPNIKGNPYKMIQWGEGGKMAFITRDFLTGEQSRLVLLRTCTSTITEPPFVEQSGNACLGDTVTLYASGPSGQVFWSNGQSGPVTDASNSDVFFCSIADEQGCLGPASGPLLISFTEYPPAPYIYESNDGRFLQSTVEYGIQWFLDGEPIPGAVFPSLELTASGAYSAQATWEACSSPFSNEITVVISALEGPGRGAAYRLFPNPATDMAYFRPDSGSVPASRARISSLEGKRQQAFSLQPGRESYELPLGGLPAGLYLLEVFDADGNRLGVEKLVKNK